MKNIIVLLSILFFASVSAQDIPDCPDGWTAMQENNVDIVVNENPLVECNVNILYCYKEDIMGNVYVRLRAVHIFDKTCLEGHPIDDAFWQNVYEALLLTLNNNGTITIKSCEDPVPYSIITMSKKSCWRYVHSSFGSSGGNYEAWLLPCSESVGYCAVEVKLCMDYNETPPELNIISMTELGEGDVLCEGSNIIPIAVGEYVGPCFSTCGYTIE